MILSFLVVFYAHVHHIARPIFSVYYYTKCALLKAGCETLKIHVCNINICMVPFRHSVYVSLVKEKRIEEVFVTKIIACHYQPGETGEF